MGPAQAIHRDGPRRPDSDRVAVRRGTGRHGGAQVGTEASHHRQSLLCLPDETWGYSGVMARLEDYSFGRVTVDGSEQTRDLIVLPDRVVTNWWRRDGHSLAIEDLEGV